MKLEGMGIEQNLEHQINLIMIYTLISTAQKYDGSYGVIDFGAGHSIYKNMFIFSKVKKN